MEVEGEAQEALVLMMGEVVVPVPQVSAVLHSGRMASVSLVVAAASFQSVAAAPS